MPNFSSSSFFRQCFHQRKEGTKIEVSNIAIRKKIYELPRTVQNDEWVKAKYSCIRSCVLFKKLKNRDEFNFWQKKTAVFCGKETFVETK